MIERKGTMNKMNSGFRLDKQSKIIEGFKKTTRIYLVKANIFEKIESE